jgi:CxxC motif-containing protein (DUF1111 family)
MSRCFLVLILAALISSCTAIEPPPLPDDALLDGPVAGLTLPQQRRFLAGDVAFNDAIFTPKNGLGPVFVASSCGACHAGDGKGHPFSALTRFGQSDSTGNLYLDQGGPQLQHLAIPGFEPEQIPAGATSSLFIPPANTGLGYLEAVSDAAILAMADPFDLDQDGISGVPNYVALPDYITPHATAQPRGGKYIGRFGRKAAAYNLLHQTANAYYQDMGIATNFIPVDILNNEPCDPEVTMADVLDVVFYLQTLKAPIQRQPEASTIATGKQLFVQIGCESCHRSTLTTSSSAIAPLSNVDFHPYTDLLLHDMGSALDDGYTEGTALSSEWRTTPLWGLGLSANSQGGALYLLHYGRARSVAEAIDYHGGEAEASKNRFQQLSEAEKQAILEFLNSL